ncbi:hypothetical protein LPJ69_006715, partial [Coemansia sp. RSA 1752]
TNYCGQCGAGGPGCSARAYQLAAVSTCFGGSLIWLCSVSSSQYAGHLSSNIHSVI